MISAGSTIMMPLLLENEDLLWEVAGAAYAEPLKAELNREVGKRIERATGKRAELEAPELVDILNIGTGSVEVQSNAVYSESNILIQLHLTMPLFMD